LAGSGVGPDGGQDQDDGLIEGSAPGITVCAEGPGGAAVVGAGLTELAEGGGVAAGFGQEVAAVAEHVRPGPAPGCVPGAAELPGGGDHPPVMRGAAQVAEVGFGADPAGGQAGGGEGLGGVLGDVVGDGLVVQRLAGAGHVVADGPDIGALRRAEGERQDLAAVLDREPAAHGLAEPGVTLDMAGGAGDVSAVRASSGLGVAARARPKARPEIRAANLPPRRRHSAIERRLSRA